MSTESPPETVSVPKYLLVEFEDGFSRLWLAVSKATSQIEKGTDPQHVTPILRQELNQALSTLVSWRWAKWARDRDRPAPPLERARQFCFPVDAGQMERAMQMFGERLRQLREKAGLTQERLAEASGVNVWTIRNYEQGRREPNWRVAIQLARAIGVTVEAFADCSEQSSPKRARGSKA
jgi:putative transcriptional regulator